MMREFALVFAVFATLLCAAVWGFWLRSERIIDGYWKALEEAVHDGDAHAHRAHALAVAIRDERHEHARKLAKIILDEAEASGRSK